MSAPSGVGGFAAGADRRSTSSSGAAWSRSPAVHSPICPPHTHADVQPLCILPDARMLISDFPPTADGSSSMSSISPAEFERLPHKALVHATGYGARALFNDRSITPVRDRLAHATPQPEIHYGLEYKNVGFLRVGMGWCSRSSAKMITTALGTRRPTRSGRS
jgi:hypothetical protein